MIQKKTTLRLRRFRIDVRPFHGNTSKITAVAREIAVFHGWSPALNFAASTNSTKMLFYRGDRP